MIDLNNKHYRQNPFTVPEGYLEGLTQGVMAALPEQEHKTVGLRRYWKEWTTVAAACVAGVVVCTLMLSNNSHKSGELTAEAAMIFEEQYEQDFVEYANINAGDVYDYLSGEY